MTLNIHSIQTFHVGFLQKVINSLIVEMRKSKDTVPCKMQKDTKKVQKAQN